MCQTDLLRVYSNNGEVSYLNTKGPVEKMTVLQLKQYAVNTFPKSGPTVNDIRLIVQDQPLDNDSASLSEYNIKSHAKVQMVRKDGVYVRGLYLEGAGWNRKNYCLVEAEPMQMVCPIPYIYFKPVENCRKMSKSMYMCPCYYFPVRAGRAGRPSFVVGVELRYGDVAPDHWINRGTALFLSVDK